MAFPNGVRSNSSWGSPAFPSSTWVIGQKGGAETLGGWGSGGTEELLVHQEGSSLTSAPFPTALGHLAVGVSSIMLILITDCVISSTSSQQQKLLKSLVKYFGASEQLDILKKKKKTNIHMQVKY